MTPKKTVTTDITQYFLQENGLLNGPNARQLRQKIGETLNIGYTNGKQLLKRAQQFGLTRDQILTALKKET